jgi:hypothetical protein
MESSGDNPNKIAEEFILPNAELIPASLADGPEEELVYFEAMLDRNGDARLRAVPQKAASQIMAVGCGVYVKFPEQQEIFIVPASFHTLSD